MFSIEKHIRFVVFQTLEMYLSVTIVVILPYLLLKPEVRTWLLIFQPNLFLVRNLFGKYCSGDKVGCVIK